MKKILTAILLLLTVNSFAQQEAQFSQNMFTRLAVNPAYAGHGRAYCGTLLYRTQWVNFPGAPKTALLNADAYFENINSGFGLTVMNDQLGFDKSLLARVSYAFLWDVSFGTVAFGAEGGVMQKTLNGAWIPPQTSNDDAIPSPSMSDMSFDAGAGVYISSSTVHFGLSSTQLPQSKLVNGTVQYKNVRHYYMDAGWSWQPLSDWKIMPSVFAKSDAVTMQVDINTIAEFRNQMWGGASYRLKDAIVLMAGMKWGGWKFGYAYDINTSALKNHNSNGHEIMIGYCMSPPVKGPTIIDNVRRPWLYP
jgi:type IX secretion system PorP/SprF family membrane protein